MHWMDWLGFRPTQERFARRLLARLTLEQPGEWHWEPAEAQLRHQGSTVINVVNLHIEYANARVSQRKDQMDKYVSVALSAGRSPPALWSVAAQQVHAVVRSVYDHAFAALMQEDPSKPPIDCVRRPFAGDLEVRLVCDYGAAVGTVGEEWLETWGQSANTAFETAIGNLRALPEPRWESVADGVHGLLSDVSYTESFVLVPRVIDRLPYGPWAVVAPSNRGVLLAADGRSELALCSLINAVEVALREQPWPMSSTLLERGGEGWRVFARDGELGQQLHLMQLNNALGLYREQEGLLQQALARRGEALHVSAALAFARAPDGPIESVCVWTRTVDSLLPVTDFVALVTDVERPEQYLLVPWKSVRDICSSLMRSTDYLPARYEVRSFPDADMLAVLAKHAVPGPGPGSAPAS